MKIYIDQSSKIEYTHQNSAVAFSNHHSKTLLLKSKDKREIEQFFRQINKSKTYVYKTFAVLNAILIEKDIKKNNQFYIDTEYVGKNALIKNYLIQILLKKKLKLDPNNVNFTFVGRNVECHRLAINTFQGKLKPNIIVKSADIINYVYKLK